MAVSDKKTLNVVEGQHNDLLKEQINLYKEINKLVEISRNSIFGIQKGLAAQIKELGYTKNLNEKIISSFSIEKKLGEEIRDLKQREVSTHKLLNLARRTGNNLLRNQLAQQERAIRKEIEHTKAIKDKLVAARIVNIHLKKLGDVTDDLIRKSEIASALGFSKMSGWITSLFPKIALFFGNNIKATLSILGILKKWYYPIVVVGTLLGKTFEVFKEMDKAFFTFRKQWGLAREDSKPFEDRLYNITKLTAHLGVQFEDASDAITKVGKEAGSLQFATDEIITNVAIMNKQLGISADISTKFLKVMASVSQQTIGAQAGLSGVTYEMSKAAGVPLNEVMDDIAKASASSYAYLSKNPLELIKAAVEARRLGTSISSLANSSKSLLSFTESIESEMEASVLTGRAINLQYARQLAYNKDFVGLNKEIVRLAKEFNYNQMDPFQAQAFAKALGKSEEELAKIVQSSEEANALEARANQLALQGDYTLRKQLDKRKEILAASEAELKDMGKRAEKNFQNLRNQERLAAITDKLRQLFIEIAEPMIPIIDGLLKIVPILMPIVKWAMVILSTLYSIKGAVWSINIGLKTVGSNLTVASILQKVWTLTRSIGTRFLSWISSLRGAAVWTGRMGLNFLEWLSPIARITSAFILGWEAGKALTNLFPSINTGMQKIWMWLFNIFPWLADLPTKIWEGIKSVSDNIYQSLKKPFVAAWDWLKTTFFGSSPSELGLLIVKGVSSIGPMLFDSLISPYKKAWDWISNLFSKSIIQPSIQQPVIRGKISEIGVPVDTIIPDNRIKSYRELDKTPMTETEKKIVKETVGQFDDNRDLLIALINEIRGFRDDLNNGKIAVNIDSQLVSTTTNRNIKFRGNYGAMVES